MKLRITLWLQLSCILVTLGVTSCRSPRIPSPRHDEKEWARLAGTYSLHDFRYFRVVTGRRSMWSPLFTGGGDQYTEIRSRLLLAGRLMFPMAKDEEHFRWKSEFSAGLELVKDGTAVWRSNFSIGSGPVELTGTWRVQGGAISATFRSNPRGPGGPPDVNGEHIELRTSLPFRWSDDAFMVEKYGDDGTETHGEATVFVYADIPWAPYPNVNFVLVFKRDRPTDGAK